MVFSLIPSFSTWTEVHHLVRLVALSFVFLTLTTKMFCGVFLSQVMTSVGFINYRMLLLSAAIFIAAHCLQKSAVAPTVSLAVAN